jgi:cyclitol reductase
MSTSKSLQYRSYRCSDGRVHIETVVIDPDELLRAHGCLILVKPNFAGVCSADVRELRGERPGRRDFGHEVVGTVIDSTHPQFAAGDAVTLNPFQKIERETAFSKLMFLAGEAESLAVALLRVPATGMEFSMVEPLACVIHAARQSILSNHEPKLILGAGFFGYLLYRYLEFANVPVTLANRTEDRLMDLEQRVGPLRIAPDLTRHRGQFSTVFLMQTRISSADIVFARALLRDEGEIVLFGHVSKLENDFLWAIRNEQVRVRVGDEVGVHYLQGTLDALREDLDEAVAMLLRPAFARAINAGIAPPLTFQQGAAHLSERASDPRSLQKYLVDIGRN